MKVLVVSHACVTPVNQQFFAEVETHTGWDLTIVTPANWKNEYGNNLVPSRWNSFGGGLKTISVWKSGSIPLHLYRADFTNLLKELAPDFIYVHHEPYALATAQVYLANSITLRCPISFFSWQNIPKRYPFPFQQMESWVYSQSSWAFPGSCSAEAVLKQKGYTGKSCILPGAIDPSCYYPHDEAQSLKQHLQAAPDEIVLGYVGRIVEEKGLNTLLHALEKIQALPWRLVVIGSGAYEVEFDRLAQELRLTQRITRLGYVPHTQTPLYLSALDILVLPSETRSNWKEQFGRVIIEALACGTSVVGSNSGEIPHLIQATGGGLVFPEGQSEALADRLKQLILDPELRSQLTTQGKQAVLNHYTNASLAQRFAQTVEQALQKTLKSKTILSTSKC